MSAPGRAPAPLPRLHLVTNDAVLAARAFPERARAVLARLGARVALHLRGHRAAGRTLFDLAASLAGAARESGALLFVNDRLDIALAAGAAGAQLGRRSLSLA
ncbi:MAG TPA: thiamine phosphate synthase, partial [Longimicrobiales bacterium]|nr:thiamine phosphate synthase [Longimicrobiales bacterium]